MKEIPVSEQICVNWREVAREYYELEEFGLAVDWQAYVSSITGDFDDYDKLIHYQMANHDYHKAAYFIVQFSLHQQSLKMKFRLAKCYYETSFYDSAEELLKLVIESKEFSVEYEDNNKFRSIVFLLYGKVLMKRGKLSLGALFLKASMFADLYCVKGWELLNNNFLLKNGELEHLMKNLKFSDRLSLVEEAIILKNCYRLKCSFYPSSRPKNDVLMEKSSQNKHLTIKNQIKQLKSLDDEKMVDQNLSNADDDVVNQLYAELKEMKNKREDDQKMVNDEKKLIEMKKIKIQDFSLDISRIPEISNEKDVDMRDSNLFESCNSAFSNSEIGWKENNSTNPECSDVNTNPLSTSISKTKTLMINNDQLSFIKNSLDFSKSEDSMLSIESEEEGNSKLGKVDDIRIVEKIDGLIIPDIPYADNSGRKDSFTDSTYEPIDAPHKTAATQSTPCCLQLSKMKKEKKLLKFPLNPEIKFDVTSVPMNLDNPHMITKSENKCICNTTTKSIVPVSFENAIVKDSLCQFENIKSSKNCQDTTPTTSITASTLMDVDKKISEKPVHTTRFGSITEMSESDIDKRVSSSRMNNSSLPHHSILKKSAHTSTLSKENVISLLLLWNRLLTSSDMSLTIGMARYYSFNIDEAFEYVRKSLLINPFDEQAQLMYISILFSRRNITELFSYAHTLIDRDTSNSISWYAVGTYYFLLGKMESARKFYTKSTSLNKYFGEAWLALGHTYSLSEEHDQANAAYSEALQLLPGSHLPVLYVGMEYKKVDYFHFAKQFFYEAFTMAPNDPFVLNEVALVEYYSENYEKALVLFDRALDVIEKNFSFIVEYECIFNNRAFCLRKLHRYLDAIDCHKRALKIVPQNASTLTSIGLNYMLCLRFVDAVEILREAVSLSPDDRLLTALLEEATIRSTDIDFANQLQLWKLHHSQDQISAVNKKNDHLLKIKSKLAVNNLSFFHREKYDKSTLDVY